MASQVLLVRWVELHVLDVSTSVLHNVRRDNALCEAYAHFSVTPDHARQFLGCAQIRDSQHLFIEFFGFHWKLSRQRVRQRVSGRLLGLVNSLIIEQSLSSLFRRYLCACVGRQRHGSPEKRGMVPIFRFPQEAISGLNIRVELCCVNVRGRESVPFVL